MTEFWTAERIEQLRVLHASRYSARRIGMELGCSRNAVIGKVHRLGLAKVRVWTEDKLSLLVELHRKGRTWSEIAKQLGVTDKAAQHKAYKIGLEKRMTPCGPRRRPKPAAGAGFIMRPRLVHPAPSTDGAVSIVDVTGCKWPVGYDEAIPGKHLFCNHQLDDGHPNYCPFHAEANRAKPATVARKRWVTIPTSLLRVVA